MANRSTFLSPGVYPREYDLSYRQKPVPPVGAAVIGPTLRGRAFVPTPVTSYSQYLTIYGDTFTSGSGASEKTYKYLTTYAVQEYLRWQDLIYVTRILAGNYQVAYTNVVSTGSYAAGESGSAASAFTLYALSAGDSMNSGIESAATNGFGDASDEGVNNILVSGSRYNLRWEVANVREDRGTFDLYIRRGDDSSRRKVIVEQYSQLSLDPNEPNYIERVIGNQDYTLRYDSGGEPYLELSGSFKNRSQFIRVEVNKNTYNYLNINGTIRDSSLSGSLPAPVSGTFAFGSEGNVAHPKAFFQDIWGSNSQGFNLSSASYGKTAYEDAIDILSNRDQYDLNLLVTPGVIDNDSGHSTIITRALSMAEDRGDMFYIIDPTFKGSTVGQAIQVAEGRNSNYAAMYYPWVQIRDNDLGREVWLPPSAVMTGVYAFNDYVRFPWYAPAGLNRGGIDIALQTERTMTQNDRDNLYQSSVNPIATFPRDGIVVWGQKTLQKKQSALDRINVRRLLLDAKRFVAHATKVLVFEQNTLETRTRFVQIVEPYLRNVRENQGLYDYRIQVDESLNTAEVIDRNELRAKIWLKPARTVEYIIVDFMVLPTGASFPVDALDNQ